MNICLHCQLREGNRGRGLCSKCYRDSEIRNQFLSLKVLDCRDPDDFEGETPLAALPTSALPGTPEKIAILQRRAERRENLWHPDDASLKPKVISLQAG